jgi:hypothetical protein
VSSQDPEKKVLEKRVRSLTTLTTKDQVPACLAAAFDSMHPLPQVRDLQSEEVFHSLFPLTMYYWHSVLCIHCRATNPWLHALIFPRKDLSMLKSPLLTPKPLRLVRSRMGMSSKFLWREAILPCHLPSPSLKLKVRRRNRNAWNTWLSRVHLIQKMYHENRQLPGILSLPCLNYLTCKWFGCCFQMFIYFDLLLFFNSNDFLLVMMLSRRKPPLWCFLW